MRNRFYFWVLFLSSVVLFIFAIIALYREFSPEWADYQAEYKKELVKVVKDEAAKSKAHSLPIEIQQMYLADLNGIDRCTSCHIGFDNPLMAKAKAPLKEHSGDYLKVHSAEKFGCTVCHYGQGRATNRKEAHGLGHEAHWDFPIIPAKYIQSACAQCHDAAMLQSKGWDQAAKGEKLVNEKDYAYEAHYGLGIIYGKFGDFEKAEMHLEMALDPQRIQRIIYLFTEVAVIETLEKILGMGIPLFVSEIIHAPHHFVQCFPFIQWVKCPFLLSLFLYGDYS